MKTFALLALVGCSKTTSQAEWTDSDTGVSPAIDSGSSGAEPDQPDPIEEMDSSTLPAGQDPCRDPVLGRVQRITDGDTFKIETGRGVESVRMIGIDTPEVDHNGPDDECFSEEASDLLAELIDGQQVWLTFDSECDDRYDRTLAYVHTMSGFVQRRMLQSGMAEALSISPNTSFSTMFASDESSARADGMGMWGECF